MDSGGEGPRNFEHGEYLTKYTAGLSIEGEGDMTARVTKSWRRHDSEARHLQ